MALEVASWNETFILPHTNLRCPLLPGHFRSGGGLPRPSGTLMHVSAIELVAGLVDPARGGPAVVASTVSH